MSDWFLCNLRVLLAAWGSIDEESGSRLNTSREMRKVLLNSDDEFRLQTLQHLERWCKNEEAGWENKCPVFLSETWPRQKKAKGPRISTLLCQVALSNVSEFLRVADVVEDLVTISNQHSLQFYRMTSSKNNVIEKYPERVLQFFSVILPENISEWPYNFGEVLEKIGEADETLRGDSRFIDMKRRWEAR